MVFIAGFNSMPVRPLGRLRAWNQLTRGAVFATATALPAAHSTVARHHARVGKMPVRPWCLTINVVAPADHEPGANRSPQ